MSQGAFDKSAKATAGRTTDLGGLVRQLISAAAPLEGQFNGEGKQMFDAFKANVDQIATDLNGGMANLAVGQKGVGTAVNTAQSEQVSAAKKAQGSADAQSATARKFSGR